MRDLLPLYLAAEDLGKLEPHFDRMGRLAGGRLDELARKARAQMGRAYLLTPKGS